MSKQISPKLISLTFSILVVSFAITFYAFGWEEPPDPPPGGGVYPPVHIGSDFQTKEGDLALKNLYLNTTTTDEGDIINVDEIKGYNDIRFVTGAAERMIIDSSGDVGIGTTNPTQKLHVVGNARITGLVGCDTIDTDASGNFSCGTDAGGGTYTNIYAGTGVNVSDTDGPTAILSFDCSDVVSTGLACSGEDIYIQASYRGAEARCDVTSFLRGDGACRTPANIVSDGGGGASQDVFRTINAPLGSDPVADSSTDTLNLSAGSGISITGNSATDTITIAATGGGLTGSGAVNYISKWTGDTSLGNSVMYEIASKIGIGTTSPAGRLHIKDGESWGTYLNLDATGTASGRRWDLISTGGNASEGTGKFLIKDNNAAAVRLTIDTSGKVGIGTTAPTQKLDVSGNIIASGTICDSGGANCIGSSGGDDDWAAAGGGSPTLGGDIYHTGRIAVGANSFDPSYRITTTGGGIKAENNDANNPAGFFRNDNANGTALIVESSDIVIQLIDYTSWNKYIDISIGQSGIGSVNGPGLYFNTYAEGGNQPGYGFQVNGSTKMVIDLNGDVGIGTTSPSKKLDVSGDIVASGTICDSGGTNCIGDGGGYWDKSEDIVYYNPGGGAGVAIGTSSGALNLHIADLIDPAIVFDSPNGAITPWFVGVNIFEDRFVIGRGTNLITSDSSTLFTFKGGAGSNYSLGIGTTDPWEILDIWTKDTLNARGIALTLGIGGISDQELGRIFFRGVDSVQRTGAIISAKAKADWGSDYNDAPTELRFYTQDDSGSDTLVNPRMTIDENGTVKVWDGSATIDYATGQGELYVENDLEVDGRICLGGVCEGSWPAGAVDTNAGTICAGADQFLAGDGTCKTGYLDADGTDAVDDTVSLSELGSLCSDEQILKKVSGSWQCVDDAWKLLASSSGRTKRAEYILNSSGVTLRFNSTTGQYVNPVLFWPDFPSEVNEILFKVHVLRDYCVGGAAIFSLTTATNDNKPECWKWYWAGVGTCPAGAEACISNDLVNNVKNWIRLVVNGLPLQGCPPHGAAGRWRKDNTTTTCVYTKGAEWFGNLSELKVQENRFDADYNRWTWEIWYK